GSTVADASLQLGRKMRRPASKLADGRARKE
ncbi:MAG: hypothetical protein ACJA0V_002491, partial [Planctomycetota bacterium]